MTNQENNKFLKALYEGMPGAWMWEVCVAGAWRRIVPGYHYNDRLPRRLIPTVPEGCKPPPEEAYCYGPDKPGAVYLKGPVDRPKGGGLFAGWAIDPSDKCDQWDFAAFYKGVVRGFFYLLDLTDHNAREILALNKPEWKMPETGPELPDGVPPTPEQQAALDELTAEGQERGEYDLPEQADVDVLAIPADVVDGSEIQSVLIEAMACGYSLRMIDGAIVGWRDE